MKHCKSRKSECVDVRTYAGYQWHSHLDGGVRVVAVEAAEQGISPDDGGRWALIDDTHGTLIQASSLAKLEGMYPAEWCGQCTDANSAGLLPYPAREVVPAAKPLAAIFRWED